MKNKLLIIFSCVVLLIAIFAVGVKAQQKEDVPRVFPSLPEQGVCQCEIKTQPVQEELVITMVEEVTVEPEAEPAGQSNQTYYNSPSSYDYPSYAGMSDEEAKEWIAQRESGGDYNAVSSNGKWYGRYQLTDSYLDGDYSPEHQEEVADAYVEERYGSWSAAQEFWSAHGYY